jgi:heme oxygenase
VEKNRGFTSRTGARFFNGYGAQTAQCWSAFEAFMQRSCEDESSQQQACAAAIASFLLVEATLDACHAKVAPAGETP